MGWKVLSIYSGAVWEIRRTQEGCKITNAVQKARYKLWGGSLLTNLVEHFSVGIPATWYRVPKQGIPEKCWQGCGAGARKLGVLAGVLEQVLAGCFVSVLQKAQLASQHCGQHPQFCQHLCY